MAKSVKRAMNKKISIQTDNPALYGFLNSDLPYGVQIISDSPYKERGLELSLTTNIQIMADLSAIGKYNFVAWLISRVKVFKGDHKININRQKIPVNDPKALELITKKIEKGE